MKIYQLQNGAFVVEQICDYYVFESVEEVVQHVGEYFGTPEIKVCPCPRCTAMAEISVDGTWAKCWRSGWAFQVGDKVSLDTEISISQNNSGLYDIRHLI